MIKEDVRDGHLARFDKELPIIKKFEPDFDITWASRVTRFNTELSVYFLKPKPHISQAFGFDQELLLAVSAFSTLEARLIQAVDQTFQHIPAKGRVDQTAAIILSSAPNTENWIEEYTAQNPQTRAYVGISESDLIESNDGWFLRNKLISQLFSRDLFDYTLPLDNDLFFFGRQAIVAEHIDAIRRSENRGLFGLRKTGKTTVLFKIRRQCLENGIPVKYYDCKLPSIWKLSGDELLDKISEDIDSALASRVEGWRNKKTAGNRFISLIESLSSTSRVCLIFDEIEYITTSSKLAPHWKDDFIPLWQTIWSAQSQFRKFCFIAAGVNASVSEVDKIDGVQNPMFGIMKPRYLTGFEKPELFSLLSVLGKRMGLHFSEEAIELLYKRYGGHPLLSRMICSQINNSYKAANKTRPIVVSREDVSRDLLSREEEIQFYCGHITSELEEFYSNEYDMLELLATDNVVDFNELSDDIDMIRHLKSYGLVDFTKPHEPTFKIPVIKGYIAAKWRRRTGVKSNRYIVAPHRRHEFVSGRTSSILREIRLVERKLTSWSAPDMYGGSGPAEAEIFAASKVCTSREDAVSFLNQANRSLVEPIDRTGRNLGLTNYFFKSFKDSYPILWPALNRIRTYRNYLLHLELNDSAQAQFQHYLVTDFDGDSISEIEDGWFQLQSAVLNGIIIGLQAELARYN